MPEVSNETLAVMIRSLERKSDERHSDNVKRLDTILTEQQRTNGRLGKVETQQARDLGRFENIADALETHNEESRRIYQRFDALDQRINAASIGADARMTAQGARSDAQDLSRGPTWKMLGVGVTALVALGWGVIEAILWIKKLLLMIGGAK